MQQQATRIRSERLGSSTELEGRKGNLRVSDEAEGHLTSGRLMEVMVPEGIMEMESRWERKEGSERCGLLGVRQGNKAYTEAKWSGAERGEETKKGQWGMVGRDIYTWRM